MKEDRFFPVYKRFKPVFVRGEGIWLFDNQGKRYLDLTSGIGVNALGHSHPEIVRRVKDQIEKLSHVSNLFYNLPQFELLEKLASLTKREAFFLCNSGAEAVEAAIKLSRKYFGGKKWKIISMNNSFHGRTYGALSATGQKKYHEGFEPLVPGFTYVPYNDISALENAVDEETCAVILEPIQGEGGVNPANKEYLKQVREFTKEKGILLIFDEIQTGIGRTGYFLAEEYYEVKADIVLLAKALGGGLPLGAVCTSRDIAQVMGPGSHGTTMGGNLIACAAGTAVLDIVGNERFLREVREKGLFMEEKLKDLLNLHSVKEIRGRGLMWGIELNGIKAREIQEELIEIGILVLSAGENVLRLLPPLIITKEELEMGIENIKDVLQKRC
ncbi:aspartate aminotransferase family protein [Dictyoglomus thermophilum]|uniref:Acetylornithine aminotransferase n=1 Tax=Dictyoglomus thermophilum (strain ATCC 35947 / DSM 3960 / H-6-12) TaxID=309799 RepID=B5YAL6_DICT6|nr:aspartate aminotransferase family protein [Dictyoglomus thermophilum]ACI18301.1 acetylornithine aminotransferase [Dictyoglomus thermophilum H-6-12]